MNTESHKLSGPTRRTWKEWLGVLLKDSPRYLPALYGKGRDVHGNPAWVKLRNRREQLTANPDGPGIMCEFPHSSRLHACDVRAHWADRLFQRACFDWPFEFADELQSSTAPKISFLFAHRGRDRLPQLIQVIRSVFAQHDVPLEVVVADLTRPSIEAELPRGVRHISLDDRSLSPGWRKSWAFNVAARAARGEILVFQDGDICVPRDYAAQLLRWMDVRDWQAVSMQRFLFYLSRFSTEQFLQSGYLPTSGLDAVTQNWKGGTIAVRRECFFEIGGFDEGFVDWGGEDDEFFDRCQLLNHWRYGYLPFVHLWHPPQSVRKSESNINVTKVLPDRLGMSPQQRRNELGARQFGSSQSPDPKSGYPNAGRSLEVPS